uniref:Uncharacterized protein n=1 Tax=viral metagenome TaxID=1070528 RepID=A0A6H1ZYY2_9ZZZZ
MAAIKIYRDCEGCNGDGIVTIFGAPPSTCLNCDGSGKMLFASSEELAIKLDDLEDKVNDILDKCNDIFEKLNNP